MKKKLFYGGIILLVGVGILVLGWKAWEVLRGFYEASGSIATVLNERRGLEGIADSMPELKCRSGWQKYYQETLGIAFCYPTEWGTPSTEPIKNLTRLSSMEGTFKEQNIYYENALNIVFEKNDRVHIRIFDNQYEGGKQLLQDDPYDYYRYGVADGLVNLRDTGNICEYNPVRGDRLKTIYSDCSSGIKSVLTEEDSSGYTYDLRLLFFKKLGNGYFDNALVSRSVEQTRQLHEKLGILSESLNGKEITEVVDGIFAETEEQYERDWKEFEQFSDTIIAFKPISKTQVEFTQIPGEDPNITTIRKYYWLIGSGNLDEAYAMYADKVGTDRNKFQERYKDVYSAEPFNFKNVGKNRYEFSARYQDQNSPEMKFRVIMDVTGDSVRTVFLEEYKTDVVSFGNMTAYSARRGDKNYVFLENNGKEVTVDQGDAQYDTDYKNTPDVKFFFNPRFSPNGNYLIYTMVGWEWSVGYIYDIQKNKKITGMVANDLSGANIYDFTENEKNFYLCSSAGLDSGTGGRVYSVPGFNVVYDVLNDAENKNYLSVDCSYNKGVNLISFTLSNYSSSGDNITQTGRTHTVEYKLTGE